MQLFRKNRADVDFEKVDYDFAKRHETMEYSDSGKQIEVAINNPYQLKIRPEKQIAEILGLSRSQVKNLLERGEMELKVELPQFISVIVNVEKLPKTD